MFRQNFFVLWSTNWIQEGEKEELVSNASGRTRENTRREIVSETRWSLQPIPPYFVNTFDVVAEHEKDASRSRSCASNW